MARLSSGLHGQLRAIVQLRLELFVNSLRSVRGRLNLVSRAIAGLLVLGAGFGGAFAVGTFAYGTTEAGKLGLLAIPFWLISLFWQLFPLMATALKENVDTSVLLRFPLSYPAYFLVRLVFGTLDIATALGLLWSVGLFAGVSVANVQLAPWALMVAVAFVVFNILLARTIYAWIEHWLMRRRSKEVLGIMFFLMLIAFQVAGPMLGRFSRESTPHRFSVLAKLVPIELMLPPGLAQSALSDAAQGRRSSALSSLVVFGVYASAVLWILHVRLAEQYRGENPSGVEGAQSAKSSETISPGWKIRGFSGPVTAMFEKELRYFSRSGPMLFTLIMPIVVVLVMWGGRKGLLSHQSGFALPVGAAYCLLLMTNIVYNSFGGDGGGIQFFLVSPVSFRQIAAAKNLAQFTVLMFDVAILWLGVRFIYQPPKFRVVALTAAWYLFAVPLNLAAGNLLSIYFPKRIDYSTFGRQRASEATILVSLGVQLAAIGIGALAVVIGHVYSSLWIASGILTVLAIPSTTGYFMLLSRMDRIAMNRREVLTTELCRA